MNQAPVTNPTTTTPDSQKPPSAEIKPQNISKIKTIIITVILLLVLVLGSILGLNYYNQKKSQDRANKDQIIIKTLFDLRSLATGYYEKNQSYKNWQPASLTVTEIQNLGSTLIFKKADYQNYIMYAFIPSHNKYFCIDTTGFADEVTQVNEKQVKCN